MLSGRIVPALVRAEVLSVSSAGIDILVRPRFLPLCRRLVVLSLVVEYPTAQQLLLLLFMETIRFIIASY